MDAGHPVSQKFGKNAFLDLVQEHTKRGCSNICKNLVITRPRHDN